MNFLKKLLSTYRKAQRDKEINEQPVNLSLDDSFVHNFINKGGKFLYCTKIEEVIANLENILIENNWKQLLCKDSDLKKLVKEVKVKAQSKYSKSIPFFTTCEHLIANNGDILFSSNQLGSQKLSLYSKHFIVYATTSQLVRDTGEGLTGIKTNFRGNIPTNISSIKTYYEKKTEENFMEYGNTNSKNLYLLLFEDL